MWTDPRFEAVPEPRRVALFREFKALLSEVEAYQRSQASKKAEADRAAADTEAKRAAAEAKVSSRCCKTQRNLLLCAIPHKNTRFPTCILVYLESHSVFEEEYNVGS